MITLVIYDANTASEETTRWRECWDRNRPPWPKSVTKYVDEILQRPGAPEQHEVRNNNLKNQQIVSNIIWYAHIQRNSDIIVQRDNIFFETGDNRLEDCLCFGLLISRHCFILVTWLSPQTPPTSALLLSGRRQNSKEGTRDLTARKKSLILTQAVN
jgi:hypothetical protein